VLRNEVWLIGQVTTEVWYNSGGADFTFSRLPGAFIQHGIAALYSLAQHDQMLFWVSQDPEGSYEVVVGANYQVEKISTKAIDNALTGYSTVTDAIGYCYQQEGHTFYVLNFPTANVTWVYDVSEQQWHQRAYIDGNGIFTRHKGLCALFVNQTNTVGDYITGDLYKFDLNNYTDNGNPITRLRRFPHVMNNQKRVSHTTFVADVEVGTDDGATDSSSSVTPPQIYLSWSDDRGKTFGNKVGQSLGSGGQFAISPKWNRLGMSRDRVYQLDWSIPTKTALQGAFLDTKPSNS
jgi:Phage stabilisation protein